MDFEAFPKIPRLLGQPMVITEKIDGTNAQVVIDIGPVNSHFKELGAVAEVYVNDVQYLFWAGSRKRYVTPEDDNFGFASWVALNAPDLLLLGVGKHFGEWWGKGIQRKYGLDTRKFSLFNTSKWGDPNVRPACCDVVPVLYEGPFDEGVIKSVKENLFKDGSKAAPGYMSPEGAVIYLPKANRLFKSTKDDNHKGAEE